MERGKTEYMNTSELRRSDDRYTTELQRNLLLKHRQDSYEVPVSHKVQAK